MNTDFPLPDIAACRRRLRQTFPSLSEAEAAAVAPPDSLKAFRKGTHIYEEGAPIKGCYFIYSGIIKIYQTGYEGKEQIIKFDREGDLFGFRSVIRHEPACTSISTMSDAVLGYIPDSLLLHLLRSNPGFAYDMVQIACKELGDSNRYIRDLAQKPMRQRLAEILLQLAADFGTEPDGTLRFSLTREELGNIAGTATETVIRLLSEYKSEGLVDSKGRKIKLLHIERLKTIAGI